MKRNHIVGWLSAGLLVIVPNVHAIAADEGASTTPTPTPTATAARAAYGVEDILKLTRAQVSEEVIATYIQTLGTVYNLRPNDIVQLHSQGVSDRIINLMLSQGRVSAEPTNQVAPVMQVMPVPPMAVGPAPAQAAPTEQPLFIPGQNAAEIAAACTPVVQEAPSTLYVIPYSGGYGYRPTYTVYGGCYPTYGYAAAYTVRLGGHHYHSYHRH